MAPVQCEFVLHARLHPVAGVGDRLGQSQYALKYRPGTGFFQNQLGIGPWFICLCSDGSLPLSLLNLISFLGNFLLDSYNLKFLGLITGNCGYLIWLRRWFGLFLEKIR